MTGRILRLKELIEHTGLSRSAIYDRMDAKSPRYLPDFPKPFSLGGNGGAIGWRSEDVDSWIEKCASQNSDALIARKSTQVGNRGGVARRSLLPKPQANRVKQSKSSKSKSLGETLVSGERTAARLQGYLQMNEWTPAMGALLVSGIEPPPECVGIPTEGAGLEGKPLNTSNHRFHDARHILSLWNDWQSDQSKSITEIDPFSFLAWCIDEEIRSEWLRLFLELTGIPDDDAADLTAVRLATLTN